MSATMVGPRQKIRKKHWLKRPKIAQFTVSLKKPHSFYEPQLT